MKIGGLWVDTQDVQGPFCKVAGIKEFPDLIYNGKFRGPWAAPIYGGQQIGPRRRLTGGRPERRPHAWNITAVEEEGGGNDDEPYQLQEGQRRDRNGQASVGNNRRRRRSVRAALGCGEKRREAGRAPVKP
jgi:hypothetical protein